MSKKKKERYIDRWRKQHKEVKFYLKKEDYKMLEKLASEHGMTVKDFVLNFIDKTIGEVKVSVKGEYERGYNDAIKKFIESPFEFYMAVRKIYKGDIALFEAPCMICKEPMVFAHKSGNWASEVKPKLLDAFRNWYHVECRKTRASLLR